MYLDAMGRLKWCSAMTFFTSMFLALGGRDLFPPVNAAGMSALVVGRVCSTPELVLTVTFLFAGAVTFGCPFNSS